MRGPGLAAGSMGACGAVAGPTAGARGGMLNGGACRRARNRFTARTGLAYARIGLASGQPPNVAKEVETPAPVPGETARQRDPPPSNHAGIAVKCRQNLRQVRQNMQTIGATAMQYPLRMVSLGVEAVAAFVRTGRKPENRRTRPASTSTSMTPA